jgi:hypothetical protein
MQKDFYHEPDERSKNKKIQFYENKTSKTNKPMEP